MYANEYQREENRVRNILNQGVLWNYSKEQSVDFWDKLYSKNLTFLNLLA